jgi:hypothetical protein
MRVDNNRHDGNRTSEHRRMAVSEQRSTIASWTRHHRGHLPPNALCRAPGCVVTESSATGAEGASAPSDAPNAASPYFVRGRWRAPRTPRRGKLPRSAADRRRGRRTGRRRSVVSEAPRRPGDDLVILAACPGEASASFELSVGVRRAPNIVQSDEDSRKLIAQYVRAVLTDQADRARASPGPCRWRSTAARRTARRGWRHWQLTTGLSRSQSRRHRR